MIWRNKLNHETEYLNLGSGSVTNWLVTVSEAHNPMIFISRFVKMVKLD